MLVHSLKPDLPRLPNFQDTLDEISDELGDFGDLFDERGVLRLQGGGLNVELVADSRRTGHVALLEWVFVGRQNRGLGVGRLITEKLIETLRNEVDVTQLYTVPTPQVGYDWDSLGDYCSGKRKAGGAERSYDEMWAQAKSEVAGFAERIGFERLAGGPYYFRYFGPTGCDAVAAELKEARIPHTGGTEDANARAKRHVPDRSDGEDENMIEDDTDFFEHSEIRDKDTPRTTFGLSQLQIVVLKGPQYCETLEAEVEGSADIQRVVVEAREPSREEGKPGALLGVCKAFAILWDEVEAACAPTEWTDDGPIEYDGPVRYVDFHEAMDELNDDLSTFSTIFEPDGAPFELKDFEGVQDDFVDCVGYFERVALMDFLLVSRNNRGLGVGTLLIRAMISTLRLRCAVVAIFTFPAPLWNRDEDFPAGYNYYAQRLGRGPPKKLWDEAKAKAVRFAKKAGFKKLGENDHYYLSFDRYTNPITEELLRVLGSQREQQEAEKMLRQRQAAEDQTKETSARSRKRKHSIQTETSSKRLTQR